MLRDAGHEPSPPPVSLPYLLALLWEIGPAQPGPMGSAPLSNLEILAWQMNMRRRLEPGEVSMLRRLSSEWIDASHKAEDPDCPPPWLEASLEAKRRTNVTSGMRAALRAAAQ